MGPGGVFGDVLGGSSLDQPGPVPASGCEVLLIPYDRLLLSDGSPPTRGRCRTLCALSAINISPSPAASTCW